MIGKIPDIRFYDFEFTPLHVENQFISSNWQVYYNDIGTFEAHFDLKSDTLPVIMDNDYIVAVQGDQAAIIVGKTLGSDLTVFGRTCNWLLTKRVLDKIEPETKTVYEWVTNKVRTAFSDSPIAIGTAIPGTPQIYAERSDKGEAFSFVRQILETAHLGHTMRFDITTRQWVFQVLCGNPDNLLVISSTNRNAYDVSVGCDSLDFLSEGLFKHTMENMGEWNPANNTVTKDDIAGERITNNVPINYGRCWKVGADGKGSSIGLGSVTFQKGDYLICRQTSGALQKSDNCEPFWVKTPATSPKTGIYRWEGILQGGNQSEATNSLNQASRTNVVQGKTANLYFGKEYALGDVVTVQYQADRYKFSVRKRIVGVNLWYEPGNIGEEPLFEDATD